MPRRPADQPEDRFLRANLSDPDNQAALLRAYLEAKQKADGLAAQLAQVQDELAQKEVRQAEAAQEAREAGRRERMEQETRLERLGQALRLVRWAAGHAGSAGSFLSGSPQNLAQVIATAVSAAEKGGRLHYDKERDSWSIHWADGQPATVVTPVPSPAPAPAQSQKEPRRKRTRPAR